jgi:eukaryotic-like serine/threonine-protein kinase
MPEGPEPPPVSERSTIDQEGHSSAGSFGRYHLLQRLGEGGMGEVWLAEQTEPVRRQVALKVIKAGMDSAQVVARFEAERQALALMDHPAIATIFDGGTTPQGRPYFAMEYAKGEPITAYCDRHRLSTSERLELFMQVCEGVQHAHQKGIIHRDLKPSNVLVTIQDDRPVPKIIDFGVAKATAQHLTERSLFTELGVLIGTPEYMSPEQAEMGGLDIDTRTDIYALGVLLYELLTGALPFDRKDLRQAGLVEIQRIIREKEPPRPSTRITQLGPASTEAAKNRHTEPRRLVSELRGDLDWITMRALEKDRTRRYQTANALAADVRRHLNNEPVSAGPPSAAYWARKFVQRHLFGVTAGATLVLLLAGFAGAMVVQAQRIAHERDRANREAARATEEAETARRVTEFMTGLFRVSDPSEARGSTITAREVLDKGVERIDTELASQPLVQARLMQAMGDVYRGLGLLQKAEVLLRRNVELRRQLGAPHDAEGLKSLNSLGAVLSAEGKYSEAERCYREALEVRRVALGPDHPDTLKSLSNLNGLFYNQGRWSEAEAGFREVLSARERMLGSDHVLTLTAVSNLAATVQVQGRFGEAADLYRRSLEGLRRTVGADHPDALMAVYNLGSLAEAQERWTESEAYYAEAVAGGERVLGADHPDTLGSMLALAWARWSQGRREEARTMTRETLTRCRRALPQQHPTTAEALVNLGTMLNEQLRFREARPLLEEGLETRRTSLPPQHWRVAQAESHLGESLRGLRQYAAAEPLLVRGCTGVLGSTEPSERAKRMAVERVVALYEAWGKPEKAKEWRAKLEPQASPEGRRTGEPTRAATPALGRSKN